MKKNKLSKLGLTHETLRSLTTVEAREIAGAKPTGSLNTVCKSYCASCGGTPTWCINCTY